MNIYTSKEIANQFDTWLKIDDVINENQPLIKAVEEYVDKDTMVIFTGAGTSGYIGDALIGYLNDGLDYNQYFSIYSTDIVDNPELHLANKKVLLVSFARSGNSPESVEAVVLASRFAKACMHLIITCNKDGALNQQFPDNAILLPAETNDLGFAMTNSYSTMMLTSAKIFGIDINFAQTVADAKYLYDNFDYDRFINTNFENIVLLANTQNVGLITELKLKFMELTAGTYGYYSDQFMNFRHGPKSVLSKESVVFMFGAHDKVGNYYVKDFLNELNNDENKPTVIYFGDDITLNEWSYKINDGFESIITVIPLMQELAVRLSLSKGFNPDNPCPSGSVNRVVQGVMIHERI